MLGLSTRFRRTTSRIRVDDRSCLLALAAAFLLSRVELNRIFPFYSDSLAYYMQFLDPSVLRGSLLEGLYYLHSQPPLFNLFLGLVLKVSPLGAEPEIFSLLYSTMGLIIILGLFALIRELGVSRRVSTSVAFAMLFFPSMVEAERWLAYPYPLALMLLLSAALFYKLQRSKSRIHLLLFLTMITCIVLTRSFFHLVVWMLPITVAVVLLTRKYDRPNFRFNFGASIAFLLLASAPYARNYFLVGSFTASSWQGMNVAAMTFYVQISKLRELVSSKQITPLALIPRFSAPNIYFQYYSMSPQTGIKELDAVTKSTGATNYNNFIYAKASQEYWTNSIAIIENSPLEYLKALSNQAYLFFSFLKYRYIWSDSSWEVARTDTIWHQIEDTAEIYLVPPTFFISFWLILWVLLRRTRNLIRQSAANADIPFLATCAFIAFNIVYVLAVAISTELGEGYYLRIPIDPLLAAGAAVLIDNAIKRSQRTEAGRTSP